MKRLIILSLAVALLTGCGVYRKYERSELPPENLFLNAEAQDTATIATIPWQEFFTDTHLRALIELGLQQNTDFRIARLRVEEAEAVLMNARLAYLPAISLNPEASVSRLDGSTVKSYNLAVAANWEIELFGKVTNAKRSAQAALEQSRAYRQAVQTQLVATIANSYYTLLMLDNQLSISRQTHDNWVETERTLEALKQAGQSNDAAVLQARSSRLALEASMLTLEKEIQNTENSLSALLGMSPMVIERTTMARQLFPDTLAVGVPMQLLANRPDVRQAEYALAEAFYATNTARAAFYPSLTLSGSAGWTNDNGGIVLNPGKWLLNAVGSLTQPLFNNGRNIANLKVAKARREEASLLFQQSLLDAGKEVNDALIQWQTARQRILIGAEQVAALKEAVRKTELLMRHTSTNYLEVLIARQNLLEAQQTAAQDQFDKIQGMINLYHALGGGIASGDTKSDD